MKKLVLGLTLAVCTAAMCASFAACGGGGGSAKGVASIEVTAAQWDAAIDYLEDDDSLLSISYKMTQTVTAYGQTAKTTISYQARKRDGNAYLKMTASSGHASQSQEWYTGTVDATRYYFTKEGNTWTKTQSDRSIIDSILPFYSLNYDSFTYSAEDKGYKSESSLTPYILKFGEVDGEVRLVALYGNVENANGKSETNCTIGYKSVSSIKLPDVL